MTRPPVLVDESDFHTIRKNVTISLIKEFSKDKVHIRILDAGCGEGSITRAISVSFPGYTIDGIDLSVDALRIAEREGGLVKYAVADVMTFEGYGYQYDFIILNNIYEHVDDPKRMLNNLRTLITDDGILIISTPNGKNLKNLIKKFSRMKIIIPPYHVDEYSVNKIYLHHKIAGLRIRRIFTPHFRRQRFSVLNFIVIDLIAKAFDRFFRLTRLRIRFGTLLFIVSGK